MNEQSPELSWKIYLILFGVIIIWGINFIMVKISLVDIPPLTLCALRFFLASIPAIFFVPLPNDAWNDVIKYGLLTFAIQFACLFAGINAGVSPGIAALICQIQVFFAIFFACLFAKQSVNSWQIIGATIAFAGIVLILIHNQGDCSLVGFIYLVFASIAWGLGNLISVKLSNTNMFALVVWSSFIAFFPILILALYFENPVAIFIHKNDIRPITWFAVSFITYGSTHFGYGCWSWLLNKYPTGAIAPFALLCPIVAFIASAIYFNEEFGRWKLIAAMLVFLGLLINSFGKKILEAILEFKKSRYN
jgi:O-acetylserine/cysteine efflux transporter